MASPNATVNEPMNISDEFDKDLHLCSGDNVSLSCNSVYDNRYWRVRGEVHHPVLAVLYILFFLVAFGWNIFILVVMVKKRNTFQLPAHIAIFALTVANVFSCVTIILPLFIVQCTQEWVFFAGDSIRCNICKVQGAFVVLLVDFALHVLALMSFDRMLHLIKPMTYQKYVTKKRILGIVIILLVLCILIVTPPFYGFGEIEFNRNLGTCLPRFTGESGQIYYIAFCLIEALCPLITLIITSIVTYRIIVRTLRKGHLRRKSLHKRKSQQEFHEVTRHKYQQQQLARVFGAFLVAYVFAWAPIVIVGFIFVFASGSNDESNDNSNDDSDDDDDDGNVNVPGQVFVFGFLCYLSNVLFQPILETLFISDLRTQVRGVKSTITESIRTGTGAVMRKGSQLKYKLSHLEFGSSLVDYSTATTESPLPEHRTRSASMSPIATRSIPLRRSHSDSGYDEGCFRNNGILITSNSSRSLSSSSQSLNSKLVRKKTRFEFDEPTNHPGSFSLKVGLETIPESGTLERKAARSPTLISSSSDSLTEQDDLVEQAEEQEVTLADNEPDDVFTPSSPNAVNQIHRLDSEPESLEKINGHQE